MQRININAVPDGFPQVLYYSQGDIGRQFVINVADFEIPSGAVVKIQATKPSGLGFSVTGTVSDNSVTFTTTAEMTDEAGRYPAELQITSGSDVIGTANFTMNGEPNPHPEGTTDGQIGTIVPELTLLVERIEESNARIEEMTASAEALTPGSDPTAEYDSENNELIIGIPTAEVDEDDLMKLYIHKTASGDIATITDGADDVPVKSLSVNIVPKQSGSGDPSPSNVRPISGWDEVIISNSAYGESYPQPITGKNIFQGKAGTGPVPCHIEIGQSFVASANISCGIRWYDANMNQLDYWSSLPNTADDGRKYRVYTMNTGCEYFEFYGSAYIEDAMVELGSTPSPYEPYGTHTDIPLPSTVYGGELDVVSGELVIDRAKIVINQSSSFAYNGTVADQYSEFYLTPTPTKAIGLSNLIADNMATDVGNSSPYMVSGRNNSGLLLFYLPPTYTTTGQASEWLASNPITVVYELANPTTVQLTGEQINTLLGSNNIWSDAGTVEVEYRADTTLAYNELLSLIASLS